MSEKKKAIIYENNEGTVIIHMDKVLIAFKSGSHLYVRYSIASEKHAGVREITDEGVQELVMQQLLDHFEAPTPTVNGGQPMFPDGTEQIQGAREV